MSEVACVGCFEEGAETGDGVEEELALGGDRAEGGGGTGGRCCGIRWIGRRRSQIGGPRLLWGGGIVEWIDDVVPARGRSIGCPGKW